MGAMKPKKVTGKMGRQATPQTHRAVYGEDALFLLSDEGDGGVLRGEASANSERYARV
jgi:hypothetical protein